MEHSISQGAGAGAAYSSTEMMVVASARLLRDGDVVFVGIGLPNLACNLARRTHAPNMNLIYEAGVIGAQPARLPLSIGDPCLVSGAAAVCSMYEVFAFYLQRGWVNVGFLGGAQVDRFGNINATVIGPYRQPKVRLPGSGGADEIASMADRIYVITPHQIRRFPERCDFITSPGFLSGRTERAKRGLLGGGPAAVVTDLGIMEPDETGELILTALHPGASVEQAKAQTGWPLKVVADLRITPEPTAAELRILRDELDPQRIYLS
jgi:glutaconate CoA-transferase subunit B